MTDDKRARLAKLTDKQIASNIAAYRQRGLTTGGPFTLAELLMEQKRRMPAAFPHVEVARRIVQGAKVSPDGRITYLDLWNHFVPGKEWKANASIKQVGNSLGHVIEYCVRLCLPILTVLVVQSGSRKLAPEAIANIYNECRDLGVDVGADAAAFIRREEEKALAFLAADLPDDDAELAA